MIRLIAITLALSVSFTIAPARTWNIQPDGSGDAPTIQAGIDSAGFFDRVLVAPGTYYEHDIAIKSGISLVGETGDPNDVIIDARQLGRVMSCNDVDSSTTISAITLTGGLAVGEWPDNCGGGMHLWESSPEIVNCIISANVCSTDGGGLHCATYSSPRVTNVIVQGNTAHHSGGGFYCWDNSSPVVSQCVLSDNSADLYGGGMLSHGSSFPTLTDCTFSGNQTGDEGGGLACNQSGGVTLSDCEFVENQAGLGGALSLLPTSGPTGITDCSFSGNSAIGGGAISCRSSTVTTLTGCSFSRNSAQGGGAIVTENSAMVFTTCTFSHNSATNLGGGGITCAGSSSPTITQCTFYGDSAFFGGAILCVENSQPFLENTIIAFCAGEGSISGYAPTLACCDIYGNEGGDWTENIADQYGINGNFSADPLFCDAENGDFSLDAASPCLDAPGCGQIGAFGQGCDVYTSVAAEGSLPARAFGLSVSPNPSSGEVTLRYSLPAAAHPSIRVYDIRGRVVRSLEAGSASGVLTWDGRGASGERVAPGVYFVRLSDGRSTETKRVTLVR